MTLILKFIYIWPFDPDLGGGGGGAHLFWLLQTLFMWVTQTPNLVKFHEKIGQRTVMMRENTWRFFFSKSLTCLPFASECVCWFNLGVLFIYSKENCIIWHLRVLASISALLEFVASSVPAVLEYRLFQTSTRTDLPIIGWREKALNS